MNASHTIRISYTSPFRRALIRNLNSEQALDGIGLFGVRGLHDAGLTTSGDCSRVSAESFGHLGWNVMLNKQDGARICVGRE